MPIDFDGTNDYVDVPDNDALTPGTNATFSAWIFVDVAEAFDSIINKWAQDTNDEYLFGINTALNLIFSWQTTGSVGTYGTPAFNDAAGTGTFSLSTWTHVAVVRNGAQLSFYIDGVQGGSTAAMDTNPFKNGTASVRIGAQNRGVLGPFDPVERFFDGRIDDVRIYNRALSDNEILTLAGARGVDGLLGSLLGRWMMDEQAPAVAASGVGSVKDASNNALDGDPTNSPTYDEGELRSRRKVAG